MKVCIDYLTQRNRWSAKARESHQIISLRLSSDDFLDKPSLLLFIYFFLAKQFWQTKKNTPDDCLTFNSSRKKVTEIKFIDTFT